MMYSDASAGLWVWLHIHWLFMSLALFGFLAALLWLYKHSTKKDFLNIVWITLLAGILGSLLTASVAMTGWSQMMEWHNGYSWEDDDREESSDMDDMMNFDE